ncbi:MAG TPA: DNA-3-methyladenine glycosylase [Candidatus Saccharimonadales bacterium]|nr:DNA-3-methyladenine glycosylase [Candidatus Saccharimonadales bacterium]
MDIAQSVKIAEEKLQKLDPKLGEIIELQKPVSYTSREGYFFSLCRSIVGQQLSVPSAAAIFARLEEITNLKPDKVAEISEAQIKQIGLSKQKASYLIDLARHFRDNPEIYDHLERSSDQEVIDELTAVKGIGVWTAQMFMMFTLLRLDVFAPDDIGLQRAIKELYGFKETPSKQKLEDIAERWKPYRTVACWHLWASLKNDSR